MTAARILRRPVEAAHAIDEPKLGPMRAGFGPALRPQPDASEAIRADLALQQIDGLCLVELRTRLDPRPKPKSVVIGGADESFHRAGARRDEQKREQQKPLGAHQ